MTAQEIEFLVALAAFEESFLYEVYSDLSHRMPGSSPDEIIGLASAALSELMASGIVRIGQRTVAYEENVVWHDSGLPDAIQYPGEWAWPENCEERCFWHVFLTGKKMSGRGLQAVSEQRARELMFQYGSGPDD